MYGEIVSNKKHLANKLFNNIYKRDMSDLALYSIVSKLVSDLVFRFIFNINNDTVSHSPLEANYRQFYYTKLSHLDFYSDIGNIYS